jgi:hypothetical protein
MGEYGLNGRARQPNAAAGGGIAAEIIGVQTESGVAELEPVMRLYVVELRDGAAAGAISHWKPAQGHFLAASRNGHRRLKDHEPVDHEIRLAPG